jgi:hypothetical protein
MRILRSCGTRSEATATGRHNVSRTVMLVLVTLTVLAGSLMAPATHWLPPSLASLTARIFVSDARANTYPVYICGSGDWHAMAFSANDYVRTASAQNCSGGVGGGNGLQVWSTNGAAAASTGAGYWLQAPAGTAITYLTYAGDFSALNGWVSNWATNENGSGDPASWADCPITGCDQTDGGVGSGNPVSVGVANASVIGFGIWCHAASCAPNNSLSWFGPAGSANVYSAAVDINEQNSPGVSVGGNIWGENNTWISGTAPPSGGWTDSASASDPAGVCILHPYILNSGGGLVWGDWSQDVTPNWRSTTPCGASSRGYSGSLPIASLANGAYTLNLDATNPSDAANGNNYYFRQGVTLYVDNQPPPPVASLSARSAATGPLGWSSSPAFTVQWVGQPDYSGPQSPITTADLDLCGPSCVFQQQTASQTTAGVSVPWGAGSYPVYVWEQDQAGNQGQQQAATLDYDPNAPGAPSLGPVRPTWVGADQVSVPETFSASAGGPSGIYGYETAVDGSPTGDWHSKNSGASFDISGLSDGVHTLEVRAFSGAGVPGPVSTTTIRIDRQPPSTTIGSDTPQAQTQWVNHPVTFTLGCTDQTGLSGCQSVSYQLDGGSVQPAVGSSTTVAVSSSGQHTLRAWSTDGAGNVGQAVSEPVLVDLGSPQGYFQAADPSNPRQVVADVADPESGVAGGQIQMEEGGVWQDLPTAYDGAGHLTATIPDTILPDGNYALRAVVWNAAGNQATINANVDGTAEVIAIPLRVASQLDVAKATALVRRCTAHLVRLQPQGDARNQRLPELIAHRCRLVPVPQSRARLTLGHEQTATLRGLLQTVGGQPIANAQVIVTAQPSGWASRRAGTVTTDSQGRFTYTVAAGPSRTMSFTYGGTATVQPVTTSRSVAVRAAGTLRLAHPVVHLGQYARFTGRLLGGYIPSGGAVVEVQALDRGVWRTIALAQTNRRGGWHARYLIKSGPGRYPIRAQIENVGGYPYLPAYTPRAIMTIAATTL